MAEMMRGSETVMSFDSIFPGNKVFKRACLYLEIFEYVDSATATEVGWGAGEGVLLQEEFDQGDHEAQLNRQAGETVGGQVKERQLKICQLHRNLNWEAKLHYCDMFCLNIPPLEDDSFGGGGNGGWQGLQSVLVGGQSRCRTRPAPSTCSSPRSPRARRRDGCCGQLGIAGAGGGRLRREGNSAGSC